MQALKLRITEVFHSLQGESIKVGLPTVFVRLTGCPLRCNYCDTSYAFNGGKLILLDKLLTQISSYNCQHICITGGEPLAQPNTIKLLQELCNKNYLVSLETSGALDIKFVDQRVMIILDLKSPSSGEEHRNLFTNLIYLKKSDQIKFVLSNRQDYDWACAIINKYKLSSVAQILFSPSWGELNPAILASWILQDKLTVRLQLQLHKILWQDARGK